MKTGIEYDFEAGKWFVTLGHSWPDKDDDKDDWGLVAEAHSLTQAAVTLQKAMIERLEQEIEAAQTEFKAVEKALQTTVEKRHFQRLMANSRTEELKGTLAATAVPIEPHRAPRRLFSSLRRFSYVCRTCRLNLRNRSGMYAALSKYFGFPIGRRDHLTAEQWLEAAQAVKTKNLEW